MPAILHLLGHQGKSKEVDAFSSPPIKGLYRKLGSPRWVLKGKMHTRILAGV